MILTTGNKKGGTGKSTSAVYLASLMASRGDRTLIVDADPQGSILSWSESAGEAFGPAVVQWATRDLARRVREVQNDYRHIVIDTGRAPGEEDPILRQALMISDHVLIPSAPTLMDVRELGRVLEMVEDVNLVHPVQAHVLLTKVRAGVKAGQEARDGLNESGIPLMDAQVGLREAYTKVWGTAIQDFGEYVAVLDEMVGSKVK